MSRALRPDARCPCGTGRPAARCCAPFLRGRGWPETAEALMRSRYTAFVLGQYTWLLESHDPATRADFDAEDTRQWNAGNRWISLTISEVEAGGPADQEGRVAFIAALRREGEEQLLAEDSHFRRHAGRWVYVGSSESSPSSAGSTS